MTLTYQRAATDAGCFRCGYPLVGIADDRPCPECGLLAARSRRETDELHLARPRWLKRLSRGVWLLLLAMVWPWIGIPTATNLPRFVYTFLESTVNLRGFVGDGVEVGMIAAVAFGPVMVGLILGSILLATPEGYPPADEADRRWRILLVMAACIPVIVGLVVLILIGDGGRNFSSVDPSDILSLGISLGSAPLPVLLFFQLRRLAKRARSAQLAEHCAIVGIGTCLSLLYFAATYLVFGHVSELGLGDHWVNNSNAALLLALAVGVLGILFYLWSLMLMIRFALAFTRASKQAKRDWRRDDRASA